MTRFQSKFLAVLASVTGLATVSQAQQLIVSPYEPYCYPSGNTSPISDDYLLYFLQNDLFGVSVGIDGTVAYGSQCWPTNGASVDVSGRIGFTIGSQGSMQDNDQGVPIDDNLTLNYGMPYSIGACWGYAMFVDEDNAKHFWADGGFSTFYIGASNRYMYLETDTNSVNVALQVDLIGDAARFQWTLQGQDDTTRRWSLWFGQYVTMASATTNVKQGATFVNVPNHRPPTIGTRLTRAAEPTTFPDYIDFMMNQQDAYGLQILNSISPATTDSTSGNSDQSEAIAVDIGEAGNMIGVPDTVYTNTTQMTDTIIPDTLFVVPDSNDPDNPRRRFARTGYIQKFRPMSIPPVSTPISSIQPQWVTYYKSSTGVSNYALPYAAVVDTPKLVQVSATSPNRFDYPPQGFYRFRVYIDNVGGFGKVNREIALESVKVTLNLPNGMFAYKAIAGKDPYHPDTPQTQMVEFINKVPSRTVGYVDFPVAVDENAFGTLTYSVKIEPTAGEVIKSKSISGSIVVASQPRLFIQGADSGSSGANLVSLPWQFSNNDWDTILSTDDVKMVYSQNYRAFKWDATNQQYLPQTSPEREVATWIVSKPNLQWITLGGNPKQPSDMYAGAPQITLRSGWNAIGNPYNYQFPVSQINGVSGAVGDRVNTFQELVDQGIVSGALAWWDQSKGTYRYITVTDNLVPNRGYWVYVATSQPLLLSMPPVYQPFLKYTANGGSSSTAWVQSDKQWRLQIAARTATMLDDQNYVGHVPTAKEARRQRVVDPPVAPVDGTVAVAINDTVDGKSMKLASAFTEKSGKQEWNVEVSSKDAGTVTVTWPNLSTLPRNLMVRLVDEATGATRDLRRSSGYTFTADKANTTRTFKIQVEPGIVSSTKIGSVVVTRDSRSPGSSVNVQYTLTGNATTTVRVLGADGREIYVPTRGRADQAGVNSIVWNLRDAANRSVAPGNYRVEIVAETTDGQRVRRTVPVIVTR